MILKPDYKAKTVFEVDFDELKASGVTALVFDLDSTVMKSKSGVFSKEAMDLFENLKKDFLLLIASNNKNKKYIENVRKQVDFTVVGCANKPNPKIILAFLKDHGVNPENSAIVGDRPLTDILAGKLAKMKTVLVDSISWFEEPGLTRFVRRLERLVIR